MPSTPRQARGPTSTPRRRPASADDGGPGAGRKRRSRAASSPAGPATLDSTFDGRRRVIVEGLSPRVDCGAFPAKRTLHELVTVEAHVFTDGHDLVACRLLYRRIGEESWREAPMRALGNDRFAGTFTADALGRWEATVEGWVDHFRSWRRDLEKRRLAGTVAAADLQIGAGLVREGSERATGADAAALAAAAERLLAAADAATVDAAAGLDAELLATMDRWPDRALATRFEPPLPLDVDPPHARFSSWYELFPRSASTEAGRHGTLRDVVARLDYVAGMGFDVLYLPPIHPIGRAHRKGRNNARTAEPGDVGSPWAIGGVEGGHDTIHPDLGDFDDFAALVDAARERGIHVALDLAFQCSPDHPYVREHPEWFRHRPDGTIQYAENPPKKYQDIYPFDFETQAWRELWAELLRVILFWVERGVTVFRVDNPHTKAFPFWQWAIGVVRASRPEVIFLAEAFTRPKVMYRLAKLGFSQSYNYFPWRTAKAELVEYFSELSTPPVVDFFRANLWPNTPDILTEQLQHGGRGAFVQRLVLAATLGASYGIYGPPFELLEGTPREPGSEEYLDSEKYQLRHWDLAPDRATRGKPGISELIGRVNRIRRDNPALHHDRGLVFHRVDHEALICYSKVSPDGANAVVVVVNLDPLYRHGGWVDLDLRALGLEPDRPFQVHDLLTDARYVWQAGRNWVELDPQSVPAAILRVRRRVRTEADFDYYL
jgi:starch synthase (maltosyl-transferring)